MQYFQFLFQSYWTLSTLGIIEILNVVIQIEIWKYERFYYDILHSKINMDKDAPLAGRNVITITIIVKIETRVIQIHVWLLVSDWPNFSQKMRSHVQLNSSISSLGKDAAVLIIIIRKNLLRVNKKLIKTIAACTL